MSLKAFHIAFVSVCLVFFLFFAGWCVMQWRADEGVAYLGGGFVSLLAAGVTIPYAKWVLVKLKDVGFL